MTSILVICSGLSVIFVMVKPDKVYGVNVPSGRIPQEIKNNRYPRTYYPNTQRLAKDEMRKEKPWYEEG